jgi:hypothetical protein
LKFELWILFEIGILTFEIFLRRCHGVNKNLYQSEMPEMSGNQGDRDGVEEGGSAGF